MQLISKSNKGFILLLCAIDIYGKYAWAIPLKDKKGTTITCAFQKLLNGSKRKPDKIWVHNDSKFYNRSMKSFLQNNDTEIYLTHNRRESVVTEWFVRTLKNTWKLINTWLQFQKMCTLINYMI